MTGTPPSPGSDRNLTQRLDIDFALQAAGLGVWSFDPLTNQVNWDERCRQLFGLGTGLTYEQASQPIHPQDWERISKAFTWAMNPASGGIYDETLRTTKVNNGQLLWVRVVGKSQFNEAGEVTSITGIAMDVTESKRLETSETRFRSLIEQAPVAMALFTGPQFIITLANQRVLEYWGRQREQVMNRPLFEALPEASGQGFEELLEGVYTTGEPVVANELSVELLRNGRLQKTYIDFSYEPYRDAAGTISGVMVVATEITEQVLARRKVEESEQQVRSFVDSAPYSIGVYLGQELRIAFGNQALIDWLGKGPGIIGKPYKEALPELAGRGIFEVLDRVYATGEPYYAPNQPVNVEENGRLRTYYFSYSFRPLFDSDGRVYGIINSGTDVTDLYLANKKAEESEKRFQKLVLQAPMGICILDAVTLVAENLNERFVEVTGKPSEVILGSYYWDTFAETAPYYKAALQEVVDTGITYRADEAELMLIRHGKPEMIHLTFVYEPIKDESGKTEKVAVWVVENTEEVKARRKTEESEARYRNLIEVAPMAVAVFRGPRYIIELANDAHLQLWDRQAGEVLGKPLFEALPEASGQGFEEILDGVLTTGEPFYANELSAPLIRNGRLETVYFNFVYQPLREADGSITGVIVVANDITRHKRAEQLLKESEQRFQAAVAAVQGVLWTNNAVGEMVGEQPGWAALTGQSYDAYQGYGWSKVVHPDDAQPTIDAWTVAVRNRQPFIFEHRLRLKDGTWGIFAIQAIPLVGADNAVKEWVGVHTNLTEERRTEAALRESEAKLRSLVDSAPFPIGVYVGREMRIQLANQSILDVWGKGNDVIGKPYAELLPELENQAIFDQLAGVYTTRIPFHAKNQRVDLIVDGQIKTYYFNYNFTPLIDTTGKVYGVMNTAADVTDLALAKQQVDASEATLRGAIELAELGTWSYDPATRITEFSDRLRNWFGFAPGEIITPERGYQPIRPADRPPVEQATQRAVAPGSDGLYEVEFTVDAPQKRIIHSVGKTRFDERGQPLKLVGTAQDVTRQRNLQLALEQQVQQRTEELEAANEELAAINEELAANNEEYAAINEELKAANQVTERVNEELTESTNLLMRSNENLQRFAYVASHDLQEPLRKIQQFGDLLKGRFADQLGDGVDYLERMQVAANRMSTLIRDLLDFSRIATQRDSNEAVPLTAVVNGVVADLDLKIQETGAVLSVDPLPDVMGDALQLKQLFQNLLSNALKFHRTDPSGVPLAPQIQVNASRVAAEVLPPGVRPGRAALVYHRIDVIDNGIGFDEKYLDRIFQVFQRLHGRQAYAGTGIGLAICEKVVTNHGGAITASSQPGQGATFSVFLPDIPA